MEKTHVLQEWQLPCLLEFELDVHRKYVKEFRGQTYVSPSVLFLVWEADIEHRREHATFVRDFLKEKNL
jgi:hypothetical protein